MLNRKNTEYKMFRNIQNLIFMYEYICDKALKKKKAVISIKWRTVVPFGEE